MKTIKHFWIVGLLIALCTLSATAQTVPVYVSNYGTSAQHLISAGAGYQPTWVTSAVMLSADTSNATTSLVGTPLQFAVAANEVWSADYYITDSVSAATGLKFAIDIPTGATLYGYASGSKKSDTCGFEIITTDATAGTAFTTYVPTTNYGTWTAHVTISNGSTAGNVILDFVKPTSGTAILKKYSYVILTKLQ